MFHPEEHFDIGEMAAFMRKPEIYGALGDALAPPPENIQFEDYMVLPTTWTIGCFWDTHIIGFIQVVSRTSVSGEIIIGFHEQARGLVAKQFAAWGIEKAWKERGLLCLWTLTPSDNLPARRFARSMGFEQEGRLTRCIARVPKAYGRRPAASPGLYDLILYALHKPQGH